MVRGIENEVLVTANVAMLTDGSLMQSSSDDAPTMPGINEARQIVDIY